MKQTQKDLLIELVKKERVRLTVALTDWNITDDEMQELNQERDLATSTLKALQEVGISWEHEVEGEDEAPESWKCTQPLEGGGEFEGGE
jgi:hypothetical protein